MKEIRAFVTDRLNNIRELLYVDVAAAKNELIKHVSEIKLVPEGSGKDRHYVAEGNWGSSGRWGAARSDGCGGWI